MNLNTRSKTIALSVTEKGWIEELKNLAQTVSAQTFVDADAVKVCDKLDKALGEFSEVMRTLAPKTKQKALLEDAK